MKRLVCAGLAAALAFGMSDVGSVRAAGVDSRRAMAQTVRELNVDSVTLGRAIDYLREVSGANIVVNWKVLEGVGVSKDTIISLQVRNLTLRKMLQLVLDQASPNAMLITSIDANVIQVTTQDEADRQMITRVYLVQDLVMAPTVRQAPTLSLGQTTTSAGGGGMSGGYGGSSGSSGSTGGSGGGIFGPNNTSNQTQTTQKTAQERGDDLVTLIKEVVRPTIWRDNGGTASIKYFDGKLIVTAPLSVQEAIGGPVGDSAAVRYGS